MNAKEFRIGNYVEYNGNIKQVTGIIGNSIYFEHVNHDSNIGDYKPFKPIQLTPEWLERFKFQNNTYGNGGGIYDKHYSKLIGVYLRLLLWKHLNGFSIHFISHNASLKEWRYKDLTFYKHNLQHVHQLQNLYFALTGEELV